MRALVFVAVIGAGVTLSACGTTDTRPISLADLQERCEAVKGELAPTGAQTGTPRRDFTCVGATRTRIALAANRDSQAARNLAIDRPIRDTARTTRGPR